jgi:hypothetical protein
LLPSLTISSRAPLLSPVGGFALFASTSYFSFSPFFFFSFSSSASLLHFMIHSSSVKLGSPLASLSLFSYSSLARNSLSWASCSLTISYYSLSAITSKPLIILFTCMNPGCLSPSIAKNSLRVTFAVSFLRMEANFKRR